MTDREALFDAMIAFQPASALSTIVSSPLFGPFAIILVMISAAMHLLPSRQNRTRRYSASTPPRSVSPSPVDKSMPQPAYRRASLADLFTTFIPGTRFLSAPTIPVGPLGLVTNRTPAEIAAFGDFPDYAGLSGIPLPSPYPEFDIAKALPRPYRPFRWAYHQTMSFKKMEHDWWIELENTYVSRIAQRKALFEEHGHKVLQCLPGAEPAAKELMEMVLQFLAARYPHYFALEIRAADLAAPDTFVNRILEREFTVKEWDPLRLILENVPEDFAITLKNHDTGMYEFRAGVICSSLGWNVDTKIGMNLQEIHQPIPDYKEKMSMSMDRYFSKLLPSTAIQRGSWGLEVGQPLFCPPGSPHLVLRDSQNPNLKLDDVHLRVDWQTLRRLPLSGAIVFNFKALFTPLAEMRAERGVPRVLAKLLKDGKESLMKYKGTWHVSHVAVPALEQWEDEQRGLGWTSDDDEVATLAEYPYFEGWQDKWHRQQGF